MKKTLKRILIAILIFSVCVFAASCKNKDEDDSNDVADNGSNNESSESNANIDITAVSYVGININPKVELTLNRENKVISVSASNEEGKILLYGEYETNHIVGQDYETAVEYIMELAIELGYINESNSDVSLTVVAENIDIEDEIKSKLSLKIIAVAEACNISVIANYGEKFEQIYEIAKLKQKYQTNEAIKNLDSDKYELIISVIQNYDISITEAAEMSNSELIEKIKDGHIISDRYTADAYFEQKILAEAVYETSMGVLIDSVYSDIYSKRLSDIITNPSYGNTIHYGAMYQVYKTSARTYSSVYKIMKFAQNNASRELDTHTVTVIAEKLNVKDNTVLVDKQGKITLRSIMDYCNEFAAKNELTDELSAAMQSAISDAEAADKLIKTSAAQYEADIQKIKTSIDTVLTMVTGALDEMQSILSSSSKAELDACIEDLRAASDNLSKIIEDGITPMEMETLAVLNEAKAKDILFKIEKDITNVEKAEVEAAIESKQTSVDALYEIFASRIDIAKADAKQYIEEKYSELKNAAE